jgi:hypothetical protein
MADRSLRAAGDVQINEITIYSLNGQTANITNQVEMIQVYEDLFSSFISVSITLVESVDYLNLFPFCGEEFVTIDIDTPSLNSPLKGKFYITKIDGYTRVKEREAGYVLRCVSEEWFTDANKKLNTAFKGNISDIVQKILSKDFLATKKKANVERTLNTTKFIANFWSPSKCINYACTSAVNVNNSPSFIFFENRAGFNFISIESLIKAGPKFNFIKDNYSRTLTSDSSVIDINEDFKRILEFDVPVLTDYIQDIEGGRIKSKMITHDITTKRYSAIDYSAKTDTKDQALLNKYPSFSKRAIASTSSNIFYLPRYASNFSNYLDVTNAKTIQRRMSTLQQLKKYTVNMQVNGRTDYTVGMVVDVFIPKATQVTKEDDQKDLILSGNYLVSAINHTIVRGKHLCNMELIKNSILINLDKQ